MTFNVIVSPFFWQLIRVVRDTIYFKRIESRKEKLQMKNNRRSKEKIIKSQEENNIKSVQFPFIDFKWGKDSCVFFIPQSSVVVGHLKSFKIKFVRIQ